MSAFAFYIWHKWWCQFRAGNAFVALQTILWYMPFSLNKQINEITKIGSLFSQSLNFYKILGFHCVSKSFLTNRLSAPWWFQIIWLVVLKTCFCTLPLFRLYLTVKEPVNLTAYKNTLNITVVCQPTPYAKQQTKIIAWDTNKMASARNAVGKVFFQWDIFHAVRYSAFC